MQQQASGIKQQGENKGLQTVKGNSKEVCRVLIKEELALKNLVEKERSKALRGKNRGKPNRIPRELEKVRMLFYTHLYSPELVEFGSLPMKEENEL